MALIYLPLVFLLAHTLFERRDILSFGLLAAAIGTLALTNHMQIVYYVFIITGLYLLYEMIAEYRRTPGRAALIAGLFAGALILGLCIASYIYLSVYEYSQFSIRGGGTAGSSGGLAWDYATNWSWHPQEILTLLIPGFFGFQSPYYWGTMPFTNIHRLRRRSAASLRTPRDCIQPHAPDGLSFSVPGHHGVDRVRQALPGSLWCDV